MSCGLILSQDHDGRRLDRVLRSLWPAVPLSAIMKAIRKGEVRVDADKVREGSFRVRRGQELRVPWPQREAPRGGRGRPRQGGVPVLWRGKGVLIVNKPAGLLVQPDVKGGDSVITRVWAMEAQEGDGPEEYRAAAVHRLDRNTTGVLAVALRGDSLRALEGLFKERRVMKRYVALVVGRAPDSVRIDAPLLKDAENNRVRVSPEGQRAVTLCRCLAPLPDKGLSLVSVELLTGRTHQARVHLAHIGCPILGDRKYGDFEANRRWQKDARRPLLHAFELGFPSGLPSPLEELSGQAFLAPIPPDLRAAAGGIPEGLEGPFPKGDDDGDA